MKHIPPNKSGSALITTLILLAISTAIVASIIHLAMNQSLIVRRNINRDRSFYLADAGLRCAIAQLLQGGGSVIPLNHSRTSFSNPDGMNSADWGFESYMENLSGKTNRLVSVGHYDGIEQRVEILCVDLSTNLLINDFLQLALYEGNESGNLDLIAADQIKGPVHIQGRLDANGASLDRSEKDLGDGDAPEATEGDARISDGETWVESGDPTVFSAPATQAEFDTQKAWAAANQDILYTDGEYTPGEAFIDEGNGKRDSQTEPAYGVNNKWKAEQDLKPGGTVKSFVNSKGKTRYYADNGNGVYDLGEPFVDDRDGQYNFGVSAKGSITDVAGNTADGQLPADGYDQGIQQPDLASMYYNQPQSDPLAPVGASPGWGYNVKVDSSIYSGKYTAKKITSTSNPAHIFVLNPPRSGGSQDGIPARTYTPLTYPTTKENGEYIYGENAGKPLADDFFLEDPTHYSYKGSDKNQGITTGDSGNSTTVPKFIDVKESGNNKVYYVDGNLYIHSPNACAMRFAEPGTKVTIVVEGNITISDEFYYNGTYGDLTVEGDNTPSGSKSIAYSELTSSSIEDPLDSLCLIAMKDSRVNEVLGDEGATGNIYLGDQQYGSGGGIHAFLYAENDFRDNNLNTSSQKKLSVFGCMAAGNQVDIQRSGSKPTQLDLTFNPDTSGIPGAPPPSQTDIMILAPKSADWRIIPGTWRGPSTLPIPIASLSTQEDPYDDGNNGHGNDPDQYDPSNPGNSKQ